MTKIPTASDPLQNLAALLQEHDLSEKTCSDDDDDDSYYNDDTSSESDREEEDDDNKTIELDQDQAAKFDRLQQQATDKGPKGVYLSSAMTNFLRKSAGSDSDLLTHFMQHSNLQEAPALARRGSDTGANIGGLVHVVQTKSAQTDGNFASGEEQQQQPPYQVMLDLIKDDTATANVEIKSHSSLTNWTPRNSTGYTIELTDAIRQGNLAVVEKLAAAGHNLQYCNNFGESVVHTAARRGHLPVLQFLFSKGVSLRVCCDSGRNPLHDACWTTTPNFACIEFLMQHYADFLLVKDQRGFTRLKYVPREVWSEWNAFLKQHRDLVVKAVTAAPAVDLEE
jgi:hypothetical protein